MLWHASIAAAVAGFSIGLAVQGWRMGEKLEALRAEHSAQVAAAERYRADQERGQRAIENSREAMKGEIARVANLDRARNEDARRAADVAAQRLLNAARSAAASASAAGPDSCAASGSAPASSTAVLTLSDVLGESAEEVRSLAAAVDTARSAGNACERFADGLGEAREQ